MVFEVDSADVELLCGNQILRVLNLAYLKVTVRKKIRGSKWKRASKSKLTKRGV